MVGKFTPRSSDSQPLKPEGYQRKIEIPPSRRNQKRRSRPSANRRPNSQSKVVSPADKKKSFWHLFSQSASVSASRKRRRTSATNLQAINPRVQQHPSFQIRPGYPYTQVNQPYQSQNPSLRATTSEAQRQLTPARSPVVAKNGAKKSVVRRSSGKLPSPFIYAIRLLIVGIGIGAIVGTVLSAFDPTSPFLADAKQTQTENQELANQQATPPLPLNQEILPLKEKIQALAEANTELQPGAFFVDLDTGAYLDWQGVTTFSAASTIKIPILVAFFEDVDAGKIRLDEMLTITETTKAGGSGTMQYQEVGKQVTALETVTKMIAISDNTATNMIIERLGGIEALNARFNAWGLTTTVISNSLPDLEGTNTTSPRDLANLLGMINQGHLVSLRSRDRLLDIMKQTVTNTLLPQGLGEGAVIAHKTGDIGSILGDAGIVDMPNGKRYIAVAMVKRPHNDPKAREMIQKISREVYQYFEQPTTEAQPNNSPQALVPQSASIYQWTIDN